MYKGVDLRKPIFEIGLKGYMYGAAAVELAKAAESAAREYGVTVIYDPQYVDIPAVARAAPGLLVFSQHMDPFPIGRGQGGVLPEALKEAGAVGTMLNHCERRMSLSDIARAIERADKLGLATLVSVDSPQEAAAVAHLAPNVILAEPPELVGGEQPVGTLRDFVARSLQVVAAINPEIVVMCSAGVRSPRDVEQIVALGVDATGTTSGVVRAADPAAQARDMIAAMAAAWRRRQAAGAAVGG